MAVIQSERDGVFIFKLDGRIIAPDIQELTDIVQKTLSQINDAPKLVFDFQRRYQYG